MTIEYTGVDGKTEFCFVLGDIVGFRHEVGTNIFTIVVGKTDVSWVDVSEDCYNFVKGKWLDYIN